MDQTWMQAVLDLASSKLGILACLSVGGDESAVLDRSSRASQRLILINLLKFIYDLRKIHH